MKKIIIALIALALLVFSAFSAFAWAPEDIITDGETEIILPLQKPDIKIGGAFLLDNEAEDHNGNKGNVYTGKVGVNKQGEETILKARGRHDPCVVPRAVPIVESMAAMTLLDYALISKA